MLSPSSASHHTLSTSLSLTFSITTLSLSVTITIFVILTPSLHAHFPHSSTHFIIRPTAKKGEKYSCQNWINSGKGNRGMDPPLVNEASFTAAANPDSYSLAGLLSFPGSGGLGLRMGNLGGGDASLEESTVTEQSGSGNGGAKRRRDVGTTFDDDSSKFVSTSSANQDVVYHA